MKVSVAIVTYNQEETIAQTIESVLHQEGNFDYEIVIGEDCSTDNTWGICKRYADLYPQKIRLLSNAHNLGILANFARVMQACTGEYVGICAGDDYWCDEYKLQKQLDYFISHPEVGVVSTSGYKLLVKSNTLVPYAIAPFKPLADGNVKSFYFSPDYKGGVYAMPLSLLIKRDLLQYVDFDEFIRRGFPVEDYPMQAILAQHCKWGHIDDLCVVYRVYKDSATFISFDHPKYLQYYRGLAEIRRYLNELFPADACFTEEQIHEQLFYKEYLLYLHRVEYKKAKRLISDAATIANMPKVQQAKRFCKTRMHFILFRWYKEYNYYRDIKNRT